MRVKVSKIFNQVLEGNTTFHHNKRAILTVLVSLLVILYTLGLIGELNDSSHLLYNTTVVNGQILEPIQIKTHQTAKIHLKSFCTVYFHTNVNIHIVGKERNDDYLFKSYCDYDPNLGDSGGPVNSEKSFFVTGSFNLSLNYSTVRGISNITNLFLITIQEYNAPLNLVRQYDNLENIFLVMIFATVFISPMTYITGKSTIWDQILEIRLIKERKIPKRLENNQLINYRPLKRLNKIIEKPFLLFIISFFLLYTSASYDNNQLLILFFTMITMGMILYESIPHPRLSYVNISYDTITFKFQGKKERVLDRKYISRGIIQLTLQKSNEGTYPVTRFQFTTDQGNQYNLNFSRKLKEIVLALDQYNWIDKIIISEEACSKRKINHLMNDLAIQLDECEVELSFLDKIIQILQNLSLKTILKLLVPYLVIDVLFIAVCYNLFIGQLVTIPIIDNYLDPYTKTYNDLLTRIIVLASIVLLLESIIFGKNLNKLLEIRYTSEYNTLYLGIPFFHVISYLVVCLIITSLQSVYITFIFGAVLIAQILMEPFSFGYRLAKIMIKKFNT